MSMARTHARTAGRRVTSIISIAGMVLALLTVLGAQQAAAAGATRFVVPTGGATTGDCTVAACDLTRALDVANDDDTISLAAGTYTRPISVTRSLTLTGPQDAAANGRASADDAVIAPDSDVPFAISADNVTIENLTVDAPDGTNAFVTTGTGHSGLVIDNNIVNVAGGSGAGVIDYNTSDTEITNNLINFKNGGSRGIKKTRDASATGLTVSGNTFTGDAAGVDALINFIPDGDLSSAECPENTDIHISDNTSTATGGTFISVQCAGDVTVSGNTTDSMSGSVIFLDAVTGVDVSGNKISDASGNAISIANTWGRGHSSRITVNGNQLDDNGTALKVGAGVVMDVVDASANWWGGPGGPSPSSIDADPDAVTYAPWCTVADCSQQSADGVTHATRYVDDVDGATDTDNDCGDSTHPCATINHAIDVALPGDTVKVAEGDYDQNVVVTKPITLQGAGADSSIVDGKGSPSDHGLVYVGPLSAAGDVTIEGFTFTNPSRSDDTKSAFVIQLGNTGVDGAITVDGNTLLEGDADANQDNNGPIGIYSRTGDQTTTTISGNTIDGVSQGVLLEHSGPTTVSGNTFQNLIGYGRDGDTGPYDWPAEGLLVLSDHSTTTDDLHITGNHFQDYPGYGVMVKAGYTDPGCSVDNPCHGSAAVDISGNTFALGAATDPYRAGSYTSAIFLQSTLDDSVLDANLSGNTGYVEGPSVPVILTGATDPVITGSNNTIVVGDPDNQVSIDFTPPDEVVANGQPVEFHGVVHNNSTATIPHARYDLSLTVPSGVTADQVKLTYSDNGDWKQVALADDGHGHLVGHLKADSGFELPPTSFTMDLKIAFTPVVKGTVSATATLVQVDSAGHPMNRLAEPVTHSTSVSTLTVPKCTTTSTGTLTPADFDFSQSKSEGHYAFLADGGLMIWTTGTDGNDRKIAGYITDLNIPLGEIGEPSLGYAPQDGTTMPGMNLWLDNGETGDDHLAGYLVNEPNVTGSGYGDNWWAPGGKDWGVDAVGGGGSTVSNAPLSAYLNRWPNAFVTKVGFSLGTLGAGQVSFAGPINSITFGCTTYSIEPGEPGSITGTVTEGDTGNPLAGVIVSATIPAAGGDAPATFAATADDGSGTTTVGTAITGDDGSFTISGVPAGNGYTLSFDASGATGGGSQTGYDNPPSQSISVASATSTDAGSASAGDANGGIAGTVTTYGSAPLAGVTVKATGPDSATATATTDADGNYSITDLGAGTYSVTFQRDGYNDATANGVTVEDGSVATVNVTLSAAQNSVSGVISDASTGDGHDGLAGVTVTLKHAGTLAWAQVPVTTDANGTYSFGGVSPDQYLVCAVKAGYHSWCSDSQVLIEGSSLRVDAALTVNAGSNSIATPSHHPGWSNDPEPAASQGAPSYVDETSDSHLGTGALDFTGSKQVDYYHGVQNLPLDQVTELSVSTNTATGVTPLVYQLRIYGAQNTDGDGPARDNGFSTLFTVLPTTGGTWADQAIDLQDAQWKSSRAIHGLPNQSTTATLSEIAENNPQAIVVIYGVFRGSSNGPVLDTSALADDISFNRNVTHFENTSAPAPVHLTSTASAANGWVNDPDLTGPDYVFGPKGADGLGSLKVSVADTDGHVNWLHSVDPDADTAGATIPLMGVQGLGMKYRAASGTPVAYTLRILGANAPGSTGLAADDGFSSLTWEPAYNDVPDADGDGWITLSELENGRWWSSRAINGLPDHNTWMTLADIAIHNPNAVIYAYGINLGSGLQASTSYVDDVTFNGAITDFEPDVATIAGTVTSGGTAVEGAKVTIRTAAGDWAADPNATVTDADGDYSVTDLPGGTYQVCFVKTGYAADCSDVTLTVTQTNTKDVDLTAVVPSTEISTPTVPNGWAKDPDTSVTAPQYVVNPNAVAEDGHSGRGSIDLALGPDTNLTSYYRAANPADQSAGVGLDAVTGMGFRTQTSSGDLPVYQLIVCGSISGDDAAGPDCPGYTTLVSQPTISTGDGWQDVTIDPGTSKWWSTRALGDLARGELTTLPQIIAANPAAVVVAYGVFRGDSEGSYPTATDSFVDDVDFNGTTTDFEPDTAAVTGTVTDAVSTAALPAATVTATIAGGTAAAASAVTDMDGGYSISGLPVGDYRICFTKAGYEDSCTSSATLGIDGLTQNAAIMPAHLPTLDVAVPPSITVGATPVRFSGTVTNPANGVDYPHVRFDFSISGPTALTADQLTLQYLDGDTWSTIPLGTDGDTLTGSFGPSTGFALPAGATNVTQFRVSAAAGAPTGPLVVATALDAVDGGTGAVLHTAATDTEDSALAAQPSLTVNLPDHLLAGGDWKEFTGTLTNPAGGAAYEAVRYDFTMSVPDGVTKDDLALQYQQGSDWLDVPLTWATDGSNTVTGYFGPRSGFPLGTDQTRTTTFRAKVAGGTAPGPVSSVNTLDTVDSDGTVTGTLVSADAATRIVTGPSISLDQPAALTIGAAPVQYSGTTTNPAEPDGTAYSPVRYDFVISGPDGFDAADLTVRYFETADSTWHRLPLADGPDAGTVVGSFGPHGGFPLPAGADNTSRFTIAVNDGAPTGEVTTVTTLSLLDGAGNPVSTLATDTVTSTIYDAPTMSIGFPETLDTGAPATAFTGTTSNPSPAALPDARYDVTLSTDADGGLASGDLVLEYEVGGDWMPVPLTEAGGELSGFFGPRGGFELQPGDSTTQFRVAAAAGAPVGTVTSTVTLVQVDGDGDPVAALSSASGDTEVKAGKASLSGTVTDPDGNDLTGVDVALFNPDGSTVDTTTTVDGSYSFTGLDAGDYWICFGAGGTVTGGDSQTGYLAECYDDQPTSGTPTTLTLGPSTSSTADAELAEQPGWITGTVTDGAGDPMSGVTVTLTGGGRATTDDQGAYTIKGVPDGTVTVSASKTGYADASGDATAAAGTIVTVDLQLAAQPGSISGTVTTAVGGDAIGGASVTVVAADGSIAGTGASDADGDYSVDGLAANASYTVCVVAVGSQSQCLAGDDAVAVGPGAAVTGVDFALSALSPSQSVSTPAQMDGWFGDTPDTAEPSYVVDPTYQPEDGHTGLGSLSLDISGQPAVSWWQLVGGVGRPLATVSQIGFAQSGSGTATYQLVLCHTTSGDDDASDCPGYTRIVWNAPAASSDWDSVTPDLATAQWWTTKDLTGLAAHGPTATLAQIVANNPDATVIWYGVFRGSTTGSTSADELLVDDIDFDGAVTDFEPDTATVTLSATNADQDLSPLASVSLTVKTAGGTVLYSVSDDTSSVSDGTASVTTPDVPVGDYQVCITGTDSAGHDLVPVGGDACDSVTVTEDGENAFSVELEQQRGSISGTVTEADGGAGIGDVTVTVRDGDGSTVGSVTTESDGTYTVTDLLAGTYDVVFTKSPAYETDIESDVAVQQGADTTVDVSLAAVPGSISGTVTAASGSHGIDGVTVTVEDGDGNTAGTATTESDGTYTVTGVPAGTYDVVFTKAPTYRAKTVPNVTVQAGQDTDGVDVTLAEAPGTVSGTVTGAGGAGALKGVRVTAYVAASGEPVSSVKTGKTGRYVIGDLAAGHYTVCFAAGDRYASVCDRGVTVHAGRTTTHDVVLAALGFACDPSIFWDLKASNDFCADISWLSDQDITHGYTDPGHVKPGYHPTASIRRHAMAAFLYRFVTHHDGLPTCRGTLMFNDIRNDDFCGAIEWLGVHGLSSPYPDGGFHPNAPITRHAMAAMIYRLATGHTTVSDCPSGHLRFNDIRNDRFCGAIQWLGDHGLSNPYPDGGFHPNADVSRQAMAAFLHRVAERGGAITGTVSGAGGARLAGVSVIVTGTDGAYSAMTGDHGDFTVANLAAGTYTVCFDPGASNGYLLQCYDGAVGDTDPTPVTVEQGEHTTVNATLLTKAP